MIDYESRRVRDMEISADDERQLWIDEIIEHASVIHLAAYHS